MPNRIIGLQKVLASVTMAATVLGLGSFAALPTAALAVTPADYGLHEGDVISANQAAGDPDVYIVNDWGYKRLFVNPAIFNLYGHLGWSNIKQVSAATRDAFITSGLFRNCETNDQKVYGIEVVSEDVANLHWVNISGADAVAQDPNFFKKVFCINTNEQGLYGVGADYSSLAQIPNYARGQTGGNVVAGSFTVSLAADNPVSSTIISGQAAADLAHFTFTGSGAVTSVVLTRNGVSSDTSLTNVYLYQGSKRLTDAATVSQGKITFSDSAGLFTVSGSAIISVKADIASSISGQTVGISLTGVNGNTVSVSGNLMSIAATPSDFGTIALSAPTPTTATSIDPQTDYTLWQSTVTVGNHDAWLKSVQLRVIGSVQAGDLRNFRLYLDGTQIGNTVAQQDANGYLVFDMGAGVKMLTGGRILKLIGDIIGGSTRTFQISLRQRPDIQVVESQYSQPILVASTTTFPATAPTTGSHTVNSGSLTITKTNDSPSGDIIKDATGVTLVKYQFSAYGEPLKVESLRATFTAGGNDAATSLTSLRNGAIYVDGAQVGSIQNLCSDAVATTASCSAGTAYTEFSLGSSLVIQPGTPRIVEVRSDIYDNTGTNNALANATLIGKFIAGNSNVQRMTSLAYFSNDAPTVGNTLTIKTGSFSAAKYTGYANQNVVTPQQQFKIGHYTLTAATSEDVNVNTISVDAPLTVYASRSSADITNMFLKVYDDTGALRLTTTPKSTVAASNSFAVNFTIPRTKVWQVAVYSDLAVTLDSNDYVTTNLDAAGITTGSTTSVTTDPTAGVTGQTITSTSGSLNLANGSLPASTVVNGGTTKTAYAFTLQPQYDSFYLDDAVFRLALSSGAVSTVASSANAVGLAYLKENGVAIGTAPAVVNTSSISVSFTGLNRSIALGGGTKTYTLDVALSAVGPNDNGTGALVKVQLSHLKYRNSTGTITTSVVTPASYQGNNTYVTAAYPTFSNSALPTTVLSPGTQTLFSTRVSATGGDVVWRKVVFTISVTTGPTITGFQLFENGVDISSLASAHLGGNNTMIQYATADHAFSVTGTAGAGEVIFAFNSDRSIPANGSTLLELKGTVGGTTSSGHSITTKIDNPNGSTFIAPNDVIALGGVQITNAWASDLDPSFLWSDSSAPNHGTLTNDWMGDGLLQGLNASQALYQ